MTYSHQFATAIKVDGNILREQAGAVAIPFGSEYSIYLKNMSSVRALAKVEIDGQDVTEGLSLVLNPNGSMDLERYVRNGNRNCGNRFKFVRKTERIEKHRGNRAEDGLVRIEYRFEKQKPIDVHTHTYHHDHYDYYWWPWKYHRYDPWPTWLYPSIACTGFSSSASGGLGGQGSALDDASFGNANYQMSTSQINDNGNLSITNWSFDTSGTSHVKGGATSVFACSASPVQPSGAISGDPGITVPGSESHQQFYNAGWFETEEQSYVLVLRLVGAVGGKPVAKAVTVKSKPTCQTCGKKNKPNDSFCQGCGASLRLF